MAQELLLQPDAPVFRPSDPTVAQEIERLCRNSIESQRWDVGDVFYVGSVTREGSRADRIITALAIPTTGAPRFFGVNGTAPAWRTLAVSGGYLTLTDAASGGSVTIGLTAASLAHNLLSATHGDTVADSPIPNDLIYGNGSSLWARLGVGSTRAILAYGDTGGAPPNVLQWIAASGAGQLLMAGTGNAAPSWATTLTGTYTMSAAGTALTVTNDIRCAGLGINAAPSGVAGDIAGTVTATGAWTFSAAGTAVTITNDLRVSNSVGIGVAAPAVASALSIGAHGFTVAAYDVAWGSAATNRCVWDNSAGKMIVSTAGTAAFSVNTTGATNFCGYVVERSGTEQWFIGISSTDNLIIRNNASNNYITVTDATGAVAIAQWLNTGTTTLATAQGDAAFGKSAGNQLFWDESVGGLGVNVTAPVYRVDVGASILSGTQASAVRAGVAGTYASAAALTYDAYNLAAHTVTITGTTGMTAACAGAGMRLGIVTFTDASVATMDAAATLYIAGEVPVGGGSLTITNRYALFSDAGLNRLDGDVVIGAAAPSDSANLYVTGKVSMSGELEVNGALNHDGSTAAFYGVAPATQGTGGENITNDVTVGGTNGTIENWMDLNTYAADALAIRNAVYQLARALKQDHDQLRAMGILT